MVCHRRAGKSVASVNELLIRALYTPKKDARYAYLAPFRQQSKEIAWTYLKQYAEPFVQSAKEIRESELRVRLINGAWITLYGADNIDALRGLYLDGVILDEFGDMKAGLWHEVILPTLADRQGWAVAIGTPKGHNQFHKLNEAAKLDPDWYQMTLKASDSGILLPSELDGMRKMMSEDQYAQELEVSFEAAVLGTYFASIIEKIENDGQTNKVGLYDPHQKVNVACDLGFTDSTAFWFWQDRPDGIAVIDHFEDQSKPLIHYLEMLTERGYEYDTVWLPHDAKARTLQTGKSTVEQVLDYFKGSELNVRITPQMKVQHGIDAARLVLPHCHFDKNTENGIEALRAYRRNWDSTSKSFADKPKHDWSSDSADAFRYMSLVCRNHLNIPTNDDPLKKPQQFHVRDVNSFTLDELFRDNEHKSSRLEKLRI